METGSPRRETVEELAEEFVARYRRGNVPPLSEYTDRYPDHAEQIRDLFPALVMMEQIAPCSESDALPGFAGFPHRRSVELLEQIGDYRILREIGRGGMGVVYEAEQVSLSRRVALKVLPQQVARDPRALERFRREAKAAARLHHTNIVPVFEVGRDGEFAFYAMQLIRGQGLDQVIDELVRLLAPDRETGRLGTAETEAPATAGPREREFGGAAVSLLSGRLRTEGLESPSGLAGTERLDADATSGRTPAVTIGDHPPAPPAPGVSSSAVLPGGTHVSEIDTSGRRQPFFRSVAQIGRQAAQGLAYAHARGIVHRDIKPSNLLLDTEGIVWITDFGLARDEDDRVTATGDILGTLRYMAPERFRGAGDARADIYALGLTLFELLTLRPAYGSADRLRLIEQIKSEEPLRPRSVDGRIPRDLETIVLKAIDKDPQRRYPTAGAMAEDLRRLLADEPILARRASAAERYARWARRNPTIAVLGAALTAVLVLVTIGSLLAAGRFAAMADRERNAAHAERSAREEASRQAKAQAVARAEADQARAVAETARIRADEATAASQAETYRAVVSEVKALRAGHQLGWREEALANLSRLAVMPTARRDLVELRTQAMASLGEFGVNEVARFDLSGRKVYSIDFSPDSRTLVTASLDGTLDLCDVPGRKYSRQLAGASRRSTNFANESNAGHVRFLPDGELVFLTASGRVGFLGASNRQSARLPVERSEAVAVKLAIDRQGRWLAVGWHDGRIDLHDAGTGVLQRSVDWKNRWDFALSPDGQWLALQSQDGPIRIVPTSGQGRSFSLGHRTGFYPALVFSPDGATLASVDGNTVVLWDLASKQELLTLRGHKESVTGIAFSPDGAMVATSCGDSMTRIWDARDGQALAALPGPGFMRSLAFSPDGESLAASADTGAVCLYQLTGRREQRRLLGHRFGVHRVVFHPKLPRLASSSDDHAVMLWDANTAQPSGRWIAHPAWVRGLAFSPDGSLIASARGYESKNAQDYSIPLWDAESGKLRKRLSGPTTGVWALAFDPSSRRLASGDDAGTVLLFDVESGRILRREKEGNSAVTAVVFHNNGRQLIAGLERGPVSLFDLDRPGTPRRFVSPEGCRRLVVDARTDRAIIGDSRGAVIALSLPDLTVVRRLAKGHDGPIESLALSPDGRLLATGGSDRRVVLRDAATFEALLTFPHWTSVARDLAFDASGRWLAFAGADSDVNLWDLGMVHDELAAIGLAWDQPAASATDLASVGERPRPQVPVIRPKVTDPGGIDTARRLKESGIAASQQRRFADAVDALQQACDRFQALRQAQRGDPELARQHGSSLGYLAIALRDLKRPAEALTRDREGLAAYESLIKPDPTDSYNIALACDRISRQLDPSSAAEREELDARAVRHLRRAIEGDPDRYLAPITSGDSFSRLRGRADFRDLLADAIFPRDPFVQPSPLSQPMPKTLGAEDAKAFLARKSQGGALLADGRTLEALPVLASASAIDSRDTGLVIQVAALQAWFGKDAELAVTCRRALDFAKASRDPMISERTAKICSLRPSDDKTRLDASLALARQAVELGVDHRYRNYFRMALGMAEYRSGNVAASEAALLAAANAAQDDPHISGTSAFYLAMSLFRQGKQAEARRRATEAVSTMKPLPADENNPLTAGANADDLILWMAYKEAKSLLKLDDAAAHD